MTILSAESEKSEGIQEKHVARPRKSICKYSTSEVLHVEELTKAKSGKEERERMIRTLQQSMLRVLEDLYLTCVVGYYASSRSSMELNFFPLLCLIIVISLNVMTLVRFNKSRL